MRALPLSRKKKNLSYRSKGNQNKSSSATVFIACLIPRETVHADSYLHYDWERRDSVPSRTPDETGIIGIGRCQYQYNYFKDKNDDLASSGKEGYAGCLEFDWKLDFSLNVLLKTEMEEKYGGVSLCLNL